MYFSGPGFFISVMQTAWCVYLYILVHAGLAIADLDATDKCVALACLIEGLEVLTLDGIDATRGIVDAILGGAAARTLTTVSIRYCAYAPRPTALRACDVLRLVQGCPRLSRLSWFCDEEFQEGTLLLRGVCNAITRTLERRGGRVAMRPYNPSALSPETVLAIREAEKRFDEGEIDEATFKETKAGLLNKSAPAAAEAPSLVGRKVRKRFPGSGWFDGVNESVEDGRCKIAWSDGAVTFMKESAVAKILKD